MNLCEPCLLPTGPRQIAAMDRACGEFRGCSFLNTWAYAHNGIRQNFAKSIWKPERMAWPLRVLLTLDFTGNPFNQNAIKVTAPTIITLGTFSKGRVFLYTRYRSFIIRTSRSISGTCSSAAQILQVTRGRCSRTHSNCSSAHRVLILNPRLL